MADNSFHLSVYYVYSIMFVQRFEPRSRHVANFPYYPNTIIMMTSFHIGCRVGLYKFPSLLSLLLWPVSPQVVRIGLYKFPHYYYYGLFPHRSRGMASKISMIIIIMACFPTGRGVGRDNFPLLVSQFGLVVRH